MVKFSHYIKIIIATVLTGLMVWFIGANTASFETKNGFESFEYAILYVLSGGVWLLMSVDLRELNKYVYKGICIMSLLIVPLIMMQLSMTLAGEAEYTFRIYMMNVLLYTLPIVIMYIFTCSFPVSATFGVVFAGTFNILSYVLNILRGTPFIPTDILAVSTAARVVSQYEFEWKWPLVSAIVIIVFTIVLVWSLPLKIKFNRSHIILRGSALVVFLVVCAIFSGIEFSKVNMDVFDQYHANNTHGTAYSFFINCCKMKLEKPAEYNEKDVMAMVENLKDNKKVPADKPNVIMVMNESYADLNMVGNFSTNIPYNDYFKSLKENTVRGELLVSPFGGYTCNTEFEVLSGLTMGLLPSGVTPYLQSINKKCPYFLPEHMNSLGYKTIALHPYYSRCWNRETVYPLMGFDEFISIENMGDYQDKSKFELIRTYYSDNTCYSAITNQFDKKKDDERLFIFNITMQNHGGYAFGEDELKDKVEITDMDGDYPQAELYLSLIRESDRALKRLIDYFKSYDEPTVVVMFGDHLPGVEPGFYEELLGKKLDKLSSKELQKRYKVPFIIWTNYEQTEKEGLKISSNFIANLMLESAGLPKNEINVFLDGIEKDIPQINGQGHYNAKGDWVVNDATKSDALDKYSKLQYYMLTRKPAKEEK